MVWKISYFYSMIYLSSGWLFAQNIDSVAGQQDFFNLVDGVELSVTRTERFSTYESPMLETPVDFHISPDDSHIEPSSKLVQIHDPTRAVLHPDVASESFIEACLEQDIPISIENMDSQKDSGYDIDELEAILDTYDVSFTLDVQHAYEHDPSMEYARDLISMAGDRLAGFHVSGETADNIHSLVHKADNRETILTFLQDVAETTSQVVPIVIEGEYKTPSEVQREVQLLRQYWEN